MLLETLDILAAARGPVTVFLIILVLLWFFLPFAVFGTKGILEKILKEQMITNQLLAELHARGAGEEAAAASDAAESIDASKSTELRERVAAARRQS